MSSSKELKTAIILLESEMLPDSSTGRQVLEITTVNEQQGSSVQQVDLSERGNVMVTTTRDI